MYGTGTVRPALRGCAYSPLGSTRKPESKTRYPVWTPAHVFLSDITPNRKIEFIQIVPFASLVRIQQPIQRNSHICSAFQDVQKRIM